MKLWDHQVRDIEFCLANKGVFNTSDPGTGKTRVCIEVVRRLGCRAMVFAPKSILVPAWGNDITRYAPEMSWAIASAGKRKEAFDSEAQFVMVNHDGAKEVAKHSEWWESMADGVFIYDESTAAKNPSALRTRAALEIRSKFDRAIIMSGTPNSNGVLNLWSQMALVDLGATLGTQYYKFRSAVCEAKVNPAGFTTWEEKEGALEQVGMLIADKTIRNKREDCLDLPDHQMVVREFALTPSHQKIYDTLKRHTVAAVKDKTITAVNAASLLSKLLQTASGAVYDEFGDIAEVATDRYELALDLADEFAHAVLVVNWNHQKNRLLATAVKSGRNYKLGVLTGETPLSERNKAVQDFQAGKLRHLIVNAQAAGHGLTLTRGEATIHSSPTFDAELFEQVNARIYRGGQDKKTCTIMLQAKNTVEGEVYKRLMEKRADMQTLLGMLGE